MKRPKPTGLNASSPPEIHIPDRPEPLEESENGTFEIKNPFFAHLFHYGMIGIILVIVFFFGGSYAFGRSGGSLLFFIIGGTFCVIAIIRWIKSKNYIDEDGNGF